MIKGALPLIKPKQSISRRLTLTIIIIAVLFLLEFGALYFSSQTYWRGLTKLHMNNQLVELTRKTSEVVNLLKDILDKNLSPRKIEELEAVYIPTRSQGVALLDQALRIPHEHGQARELVLQARRSLLDLEKTSPFEFKSLDGRPATQRLFAEQYLLEASEALSQAQILLADYGNLTYEKVEHIRLQPLKLGLVLMVVFVIIILVIGFRESGRINQSIRNLLQATSAVASGQLGFRAPVLHEDEIGSLTNSFNVMTEVLDKTTVTKNYVESIIESMQDFVLVLSAEGTILRANQVGLELLEFDSEELIGRNISSLFDEGFVFTKSSQDHEARCKKKSGEFIDVAVTVSPMKYDAKTERKFVCVIEDITARKHAEEELQSRNVALANANRELEAFSYSVSHDLRSPLRAIDGFGMALAEDYSDELDGEAKEYIERIRSATQTMGRLIDDLLNLSRLSRTSMKITDVNLSEFAAKIFEEFKIREPQRKLYFKIEPDVHAVGDSALLKVVMENLLDNAFKYTSAHSEAHVEFGRVAGKNPITFYVKDDGAGFDMTYANKLFGAFQRLHTASEFKGTGVGLATVQRIIHRHGGSIWVEAKLEQGATFYFTL